MIKKENQTYIIAEAGVNHNGSFDIAKELIEKSAHIGADAIKFQIFNADLLAHPDTKQADYQKIQSKTSTQHELLAGLALKKEEYIELKNIADQHKIQFLATPFDFESLGFLITLNVPYIKVSSGDLTHGPLLLKIAQNNQKVILSTGMGNLEEIRQALYILAYGYAHSTKQPKSFKEILDFCCSNNWRSFIQDKVVILHCTSEYPAPVDEINLNVLDTLHTEFSLTVGYSDHSTSLLVPCLAVSKGARVIEKHITLSNEMEGPDHKASLNIEDFAEQIRQIRLTEKILGSFEKVPTHSELKNKAVVRRGIYAACNIKKDQIIDENDLIYLRPEGLISPVHTWDIVGTPAKKNYETLDSL